MNINIISASLPPPIGAGHDNERIITKYEYDYDDLLSMGWMLDVIAAAQSSMSLFESNCHHIFLDGKKHG